MLTAQNGSVIELYSGTLTMAVAAIRTRRQCTVIEKDKYCFDDALKRLHMVAYVIKMQQWKNMDRNPFKMEL